MKTLIRPASRAGVEDVKALSELTTLRLQLTPQFSLRPSTITDGSWLATQCASQWTSA